MDIYTLCDSLTRLKIYPVFEIAHYTLMCINVKEDIQKTVTFQFSRQHPLSSWFASMLLCFASQIWFCFLFNQPLATVLVQTEKIALASAVWYVINYMPGDFIYKLLSYKLFKVIAVAMKEVHRVYGIHAGVSMAIKKYPSYYLVHVVAGILKGSSYVWMKPIDRFVCGQVIPNKNEWLQPSFVMKGSAVVALLFTLNAANFIQVEHALLMSGAIAGLVYLRVSTVLLGTGDPFVPFENLTCSLLFGGMWDALQRARSKPSEEANGAVEAKVKKS